MINLVKKFKGVFSKENDEQGEFFWTEKSFEIVFNKAIQYGIIINLHTPVVNNSFSVICGEFEETIETVNKWCTYNLLLPSGSNSVKFEIKKIFRPNNDVRDLGVCIRSIQEITENEYDNAILNKKKHNNMILNRKEFLDGKTILESVPVNMAIGTEKRCNIGENEPCVYCDYKAAVRTAEQTKIKLFSTNNSDEYGKFYNFAEKIIDCSYGEPFMNAKFSDIVNLITMDKHLSFTSNGQFLNADNIKLLLGKDIDMYCSIDAASAESYKKYRNSLYNKVIDGISVLCKQKKQYNNLPNVYISFIVMNSNKNELLPFIKKMHDIDVDYVILRRLLKSTTITKEICKGEFKFNYVDEIMSDEDFDHYSKQAIDLANKLGIKIIDQGKNFISNEKILCSDPWDTLYCMPSGIYPCCYSSRFKKGIVSWDEKPEDKSMEEFIKDAFNSEIMQDIRKNLANGKFSKYCLSVNSCPIIAAHKGEVKEIEIIGDK